MAASIDLFRNDPHAVVAAGTAIFRDGETGDTMYGVIEGDIAIVKHGVLIEDIGPGGIVGEMALIDKSPRSADAIARTESRLSVINLGRFEHLVANHPTFALRVMAIMAERLRRTNDQRTSGPT